MWKRKGGKPMLRMSARFPVIEARKGIPFAKIYVGTGRKVRANRERDGM